MTKTRALGGCFVILLLAIAANTWIGLNGKGKSETALRAVASGAHNQLVNRATNVEAWCEGINAGRRYDRRFVRQVTGAAVIYALGDLDCAELIRVTLKSPQKKSAVTEASNPLVYRTLHP